MKSCSDATGPPAFIGCSGTLRNLDAMLSRVAASWLPSILIEGEPGTGKGLAAIRLHRLSARARGPFISVNCSRSSGPELATALFGTQRPVTGHQRSCTGLVHDARGGSLFLDEIDAAPPLVQAQLLRVFDESDGTQFSDVSRTLTSTRIVAATRTDLLRAVDERAFRADLYYRLTAMTIRVPPLRERPEDIEELTMHYVRNCNRTYMTSIREVAPAAMALLRGYSWPGNVRELRDVVERAALTESSKVIKPLSIHLTLRYGAV